MLEKYENQKIDLIATIGRKGVKKGYDNKCLCAVTSLLLTDIYDIENNYISDHIWLKCAKCLEKYQEGDRIKLKATVKKYRRTNKTIDYGLIYPNHKVELVIV